MLYHLVQVVMEELNLSPAMEHKVVFHSAHVLCLISFVELTQRISVEERLLDIQVLREVYLCCCRVKSVVIGRISSAWIQDIGAKLRWIWYVLIER